MVRAALPAFKQAGVLTESDRPIIRVYKKVQRNKEGRLVGRPESPYLSTELVCLANPSFADNDYQPLPDEIVPTDSASSLCRNQSSKSGSSEAASLKGEKVRLTTTGSVGTSIKKRSPWISDRLGFRVLARLPWVLEFDDSEAWRATSRCFFSRRPPLRRYGTGFRGGIVRTSCSGHARSPAGKPPRLNQREAEPMVIVSDDCGGTTPFFEVDHRSIIYPSRIQLSPPITPPETVPSDPSRSGLVPTLMQRLQLRR